MALTKDDGCDKAFFVCLSNRKMSTKIWKLIKKYEN